uniref:Secreted protein n=1 Tax=Mesocestoides corti TaxID=53468 RepID=A0A5K3FLQ3_MESCO
ATSAAITSLQHHTTFHILTPLRITQYSSYTPASASNLHTTTETLLTTTTTTTTTKATTTATGTTATTSTTRTKDLQRKDCVVGPSVVLGTTTGRRFTQMRPRPKNESGNADCA